MNPNPPRFWNFTKSRIANYLIKVSLVAISYALTAKLAVSIPGVHRLGSAVWPPAGIAQAALILMGTRLWVGVALGAFLFDIIQQQFSLFNALASGLGASLQAVLAVIWLKRFNFNPAMNRVIDVVKLIGFGALVAPQINSTLGAFRLCVMEFIPWSDFWSVRSTWFLGDSMGVLVFSPLILILAQSKLFYQPLKSSLFKPLYLVGTFSFLLLIIVSWVVFASKTQAAIASYPLEYFPFPFIIWAAIQFGQKASIIASFIVSTIAIWGSSQGGGPFVTKADNLNQAILLLQTFMSVITITALLLSATVTERALAENSLKESELKYRELVENANSIILKIDTSGRITFFNEFAQQFFGYSQEEILNQMALGLVIPYQDSEGQDLEIMMKNILTDANQFTRNENENIKKNGERVWVAWSNKPLVDEQGKLIGLLCIGTDITERRKAEIALQQLNEELERRVEERTEALRYQQENSERLLLNILPEAIAKRLKQGDITIADSFGEATVLFADIVGFTYISSAIPPEAVVELLNQIFSTFDQLAEKYGLEKIKTIGDAYMVVGGVPNPRFDHVEAVAEMGLAMQEVITQFKTPTGEVFRLRIGIHTGPVVAGVIGIKKFIYDLWGDTVNIASRMEAQGQEDQIQVTETIYARLKNQYNFECRGTIFVKGKGNMTTYFLTGSKAISKTLEPHY